MSVEAGVAALEGVAASSVSSMTKAASNTAGSGFGADPSLFASLDEERSSLAFLDGRDRRAAADCVPALLEDSERRRAGFPGPGPGACLVDSRAARCLACSSAIVRSIAPLSLCRGQCQFALV